MNTVTITREFSGFSNVEDTMLVGQHDVAGTVADYILPAGYTVHDGRIFDVNSIECFINPRRNGVELISRAGSAPDVVLVAA